MNIYLKDSNISIMYLDIFRQYGFPLAEDDGTHDIIPIKLINYCPWCNTKLPKNCRDEWFHTLKQEYNIDDPWNEEQIVLIPEEFKNDEWWIKRRL